MAEKYWVGGAGTWDNSTTTNWSNSNGGAGGAAVPSATDNANFTTSSGNGTVTIAATAACANLVVNWTAVKTNIFSLSGNFSPAGNITINGNSTINRILIQSSVVGTQRTITNLGTVACTNVDFMDIKFNTAVDFSAQTNIGDANGNSGITFPASVAQYYGGVNLNGSYLRCNGISGNYISTPDSAALSITGDIEMHARVSPEDWTPSANVIFIAKKVTTGNQRSYLFGLNGTALYFEISTDGTSTLSVAASSASTGFTDGTPHWVKMTYVKSTGVTQFYTADDSATVPSSWTKLGDDVTTIAANTAIYDGTAPLEIGSALLGTNLPLFGKMYRARVLNGVGGTVVFDADFTAQAAGTKSFTESSAQGATVSLTVTGGNWSASSWTTRVPLPQDDAYLGNAYAASQTVTADMPRLGRSIDWTGATGSPTFSTTVGNSIYGSHTLVSGMTYSASGGNVTYAGRGTYSITSSGVSHAFTTTFNAVTGTYSLNDAFSQTVGGTGIVISNGSFNSNNFNISCVKFTINGSVAKTITLGSSTLTTTTTSATNVIDLSGSNLTFSALSSTINITGASASTRTFVGSGYSYGTLQYTVAGSTGELDITGSNSFAAINFSDVTNARSLKFTAGTTTTIRNGNGFNVRGTSGKLMTIDTITGASTFTLTSPNQQSTDYITPTRSTVDASPKWYAGANSTDGTGNTNWIFTNSPESVNSFTLYSEQYCLNFIYGTPDTQYSLQEIANLYNGTPSTKLSFQEVLNHREGLPPNARSAQEALFENVKTVLGLSDPYTQYSVQYLLNLCKSRGIGLSTIFG